MNKDQSFLFQYISEICFIQRTWKSELPEQYQVLAVTGEQGRNVWAFLSLCKTGILEQETTGKVSLTKGGWQHKRFSISLWWFQKMQWSVCTKMNIVPLRTLTWRSLVKRTSPLLFPTVNLGATQLVSLLVRRKGEIFISPPCVWVYKYTDTQICMKQEWRNKEKMFCYLYKTFPSAGTPSSSDNWGWIIHL